MEQTGSSSKLVMSSTGKLDLCVETSGGGRRRRRVHRRGKKRKRHASAIASSTCRAAKRTLPTRSVSASNTDEEEDDEIIHAPNNTTQFIMEDHSDTIQYLDHKLAVTKSEDANSNSSNPVSEIVTRAKVGSKTLPTSSMSSVSAMETTNAEMYYSSAEDEEAFVSREFLKDYDQARSDRLVAMSKSDLVAEYLQMEARIEGLERRDRRATQGNAVGGGQQHLRQSRLQQAMSRRMNATETSATVLLQSRIATLMDENAALRARVARLEREKSCSSSTTTSGSGSGSSGSNSDNENEVDAEEVKVVNNVNKEAKELETGSGMDLVEVRSVDTGYDSGHSGHGHRVMGVNIADADNGAKGGGDNLPTPSSSLCSSGS